MCLIVQSTYNSHCLLCDADANAANCSQKSFWFLGGRCVFRIQIEIKLKNPKYARSAFFNKILVKSPYVFLMHPLLDNSRNQNVFRQLIWD